MLLSLLFVTLFVAEDWVLPAALVLTLSAVAGYILSRPHRFPA